MPATLDAPPPTTQPAQRTAPAIGDPSPKPKVETPSPKDKPTSVDPQPDVPNDKNPFFEMEARFGLNDDPVAKKPEGETEESDTEPDEPEDKSDKAKKPAETTDKDKRTIKPKEGGQLRTKLEATIKELEAERKAKADLEERLKTAKPAEEVTSLSERLAAVEKEREAIQAELMMHKQEVTPEFKQKYEEPFNQEAKRAAARVSQLLVTNADGTTRAGSWEHDFAAIYNLPYAEAADKAEALFGKHASRVMMDYDRLHNLDETYKEALANEKQRWKQTAAERQANEAKNREAFNSAYAAAKEGFLKRFPERFGEDPNDPQVAKELEKGRTMFAQQPKTFQEAVTKQAAMELAVTAHPKLVYQLEKTKKERDALAAKLKEYEKSEPGDTTRKTGESAQPDDEEAELRRFMATK